MPKLFIYDQALVFAALNLSSQVVSRYERLVRGDDAVRDELKLKTLGTARDPNSGERWIHQYFGRRMEVTRVSADADLFWMPVWPYGLCTATRELRPHDHISHMGQFMIFMCPAITRAFAWLSRQPPWRRSRGADHIFLGLQFKDRLARWYMPDYCERAELGRTPRKLCEEGKIGFEHQRVGYELLANSVFATTEDRLPEPSKRDGQTSVVIPYYAGPRWWAEGLSYEQVVAAKRTLLAFYGNSKGFKCHLEHGACLPQPSHFNPNGVRKRILAAVRAANGTARDIHHQTPALMLKSYSGSAFDGPRMVLEARFCPVPLGDAYATTRLYTSLMSVCIPIIISDRLPLPFASAVDWPSLVLRIPELSLVEGYVKLADFARNVSASRVARMQRAIWEARHLLAYNDSADGGDVLRLLAADLVRAVGGNTRRVVLLERLGTFPCVHGHSFGETYPAGGGSPTVWTRHGCRGRFAAGSCLSSRAADALDACAHVITCGASCGASGCPPPPPGSSAYNDTLGLRRDPFLNKVLLAGDLNASCETAWPAQSRQSRRPSARRGGGRRERGGGPSF